MSRYERAESGRGRQSFGTRKRRGWDMNLYRNTRRGKIAGVAAGIADYWDVAHWVVRLVWVGAFLFTGTLALWAYLAGWLLLSARPADRYDFADPVASDGGSGDDGAGVAMEYDERRHDYRPRKMFRYSESASVRLQRAQERLDAALRRVEGMESYVTSRQYKLNSEFSRL